MSATSARLGFVDVDRVASLSSAGKAAAAKLLDLRKKKEAEAAQRSRKVEELQQKMLTSEALLNDVARARLERDVQRAQLELRQFAEQAQSDVQYLQQDLLRAFTARLFPIIGEVAKERDLLAVFSSGSGVIWHDPSIDLSEEIARRLDSAEQR
jgi:Skp family chaperone for outer membrane proteins